MWSVWSKTVLPTFFYFAFFGPTGYSQSNFKDETCITPDRIDGKCVDIRQCQSLLKVLQTLKRPHPPSVVLKLRGYKCGKDQVCCPPGPITLELPMNYHDRTEAPDVTNHKNIRILPENCGFLEDDDNKLLIAKGEDAALNQFPWMALLQYRTHHGLDFLCGGTIINDNYILTAAHCLVLEDTQIVSVRVGEHSIKNTTDCEVENNPQRTLKCNPPVQDLSIEEIIPHPQYTGQDKSIFNDIALLRVSRIKRDVNVIPVCLPIGEARDLPLRLVYVTGWGLKDSETRERADILQRIGVQIKDKKMCAATYRETGIDLTNTQICAGGDKDGKAFCSGDSGGPMLVPTLKDSEFVFVQQGIVSLGPRYCGIKGYPGIYTLVKFYMDWILDNMKP